MLAVEDYPEIGSLFAPVISELAHLQIERYLHSQKPPNQLQPGLLQCIICRLVTA